jgi:hypothetical protein
MKMKNILQGTLIGAKKTKDVFSTKKAMLVSGVVAGILGTQAVENHTTHANQVISRSTYSEILRNNESNRVFLEEKMGEPMVTLVVASKDNVAKSYATVAPLNAINGYTEKASVNENPGKYVSNKIKWGPMKVKFATYTNVGNPGTFKNDIVFTRSRFDLIEDADDYKGTKFDPNESAGEEYVVLAAYNPHAEKLDQQYKFFNPVIDSEIENMYEK